MTIERKTIVGHIGLERDGSVTIRLDLLLVEDGLELSCKFHRYAAADGVDPLDFLPEVNAHLAEKGEAPLDADGVRKLAAVNAYRAALAEGE